MHTFFLRIFLDPSDIHNRAQGQANLGFLGINNSKMSHEPLRSLLWAVLIGPVIVKNVRFDYCYKFSGKQYRAQAKQQMLAILRHSGRPFYCAYSSHPIGLGTSYTHLDHFIVVIPSDTQRPCWHTIKRSKEMYQPFEPSYHVARNLGQ